MNEKKERGISEDSQLSFSEVISRLKSKNCEMLLNESEYSDTHAIADFLCKTHNKKFTESIYAACLDGVNHCDSCEPTYMSKQESEILEYTQSLRNKSGEPFNIIIDRTNNTGNLKFEIPEHNFVLEYIGLYSNTVEHTPCKKYHLENFNLAKDQGKKLFQIFEDEWRNKKDIWKSMIKVNLGIASTKLSARNLTVDDDCDVSDIRKFIDENHMQGYCNSAKKIALRDRDGKIVLCLTLRRPFTKKAKNIIEIARLCSAKDVVVRGGFTKVMKRAIEWAKMKEYDQILTYSDCRHSWGEAYLNNGFVFVCSTNVGYDYTDYFEREGRFKNRAKPGQPEAVLAKEKGIWKIFNAGNYSWRLDLTQI